MASKRILISIHAGLSITSVADLDPDWIRIQIGAWIQIWIPNPIRIQQVNLSCFKLWARACTCSSFLKSVHFFEFFHALKNLKYHFKNICDQILSFFRTFLCFYRDPEQDGKIYLDPD
jgi:hypothetical protein